MPVNAPSASPLPTALSGQVQTELPAQAAVRQRINLAQNESFLYWVSPTEVVIRQGEPMYQPIRVPIVSGANGVGPSGDPSAMHAWQESRRGRRRVPLDFKVQAWGEEVTGYLCKMQVDTDGLGKPLYHYHDVWTRYLVLGADVIREFDMDGWIDFCRRVESLLGAPPNSTVVRFETGRIKALAQEHARLAPRSPALADEAVRLAETIEPPQKKTAKKPAPQGE